MEKNSKQPRGRPFKPGQCGNPKGRPKSISFDVKQILAEKGCDPFKILADIASGTLDKKEITVRCRLEAAAELAQYCAPKLKSVELSGNADSPMNVWINTQHGNAITPEED